MAKPLTHALICAGCTFWLAGCYSPQPLVVTPSVGEWRASQVTPETSAVTSESNDPWSAEAMVARALNVNPDLLSWSARVEASAAAVRASGDFDDIELRLTRANLSDFEKGEPRFDIALRGRPPRPGVIASRKDAARLRVEEVSALRDDAKRGIRAEVRRLHATLTFDARERGLLGEELVLRDQALEAERGRLELSDSTHLEVVLAELERAEVADQLAELALESAGTERALRMLIDLRPEVSMTPSGAPGGVAQDAPALRPDDRDTWVDEGLSQRASLRRTVAALGRARAEAHRAGVSQWPWFDWVELSYELTEKAEPLNWGLALSLDLPIFAWTGAETSAADALTRQRKVEHRGTITRIAREIETAFHNALDSHARYEALQKRIDALVVSTPAPGAQGDALRNPDRRLARRLALTTLSAKRRALDAQRAWVEACIALDEAVGR